jgi:hypothetical protein
VRRERRILGFVGLLLSACTLAAPARLQAQVGISSRPAQVILVARTAAHAAIDSVGVPEERETNGGAREVSVPLHLFANTVYRVIAVRSDTPSARSSRIWVRTETGEFRVLEAGSRLVVARGHPEGKQVLNVLYRVESAGAEPEAPSLRYELAVNPQL